MVSVMAVIAQLKLQFYRLAFKFWIHLLYICTNLIPNHLQAWLNLNTFPFYLSTFSVPLTSGPLLENLHNPYHLEQRRCKHEQGLGLFATQRIPLNGKNNLIAAVPYKDCIWSSDLLKKNPSAIRKITKETRQKEKRDLFCLVVCLYEELEKGSQSKWWNYFVSQPKEAQLPAFNSEQLDCWRQSSVIPQSVIRSIENERQTCEEIRKMLERLLRRRFHQTKFNWCWFIAKSRSQNPHVAAPLCLMPFLDKLNHSSLPQAQLFGHIQNKLVLKAIMPIEEGDQIYINYDYTFQMSNRTFFYEYNFAPIVEVPGKLIIPDRLRVVPSGRDRIHVDYRRLQDYFSTSNGFGNVQVKALLTKMSELEINAKVATFNWGKLIYNLNCCIVDLTADLKVNILDAGGSVLYGNFIQRQAAVERRLKRSALEKLLNELQIDLLLVDFIFWDEFGLVINLSDELPLQPVFSYFAEFDRQVCDQFSHSIKSILKNEVALLLFTKVKLQHKANLIKTKIYSF